MAEQQAIREEEERLERLRLEQEAEEERLRAEQYERDMAAVACYAQALRGFRTTLDRRLKRRAEQAEKLRQEQETREKERRQRQQARQSSSK